MIFGVLNADTTYIRYVNRDWDPDTCDLRASSGNARGFTLAGRDYVTLERMQIRGALTPIVLDGSDHNIIQHCVVENGDSRMLITGGSAYNSIRDNYFTLGYGSYGHFGEWGTYGELARRCAMYALGKFVEGHSSSLDGGIRLSGCGSGNDISNNVITRGSIGISMWNAPNVSIHDNTISQFSSVGLYLDMLVESLSVHDNDLSHCNGCIRLGSIGAEADTNRSGFIYNNIAYNDSGAGQFLITHVDSNYYARVPDFWFYHNSYAGGDAWGQALLGPCGRMKVLDNIMSGKNLMAGAGPADETTHNTFAVFDYNFLGGLYRGYRYFGFAAYDRHNQWSTDTMVGDINHQVWPLGSEPDWNVPGTSTAYQSGLDLSDSFSIRGVRYGPLPGMTPGYFPGAKPNLGAVQNTSPVGIPQRDPGRGSVARLPELTFAPNPATGKHARVRCAIAAGTVGKLALHDVLGRTVKSLALVPSDITPQLDLRGLAPGVYMATLEAGTQSLTRKFVITGR
jgi:parallel beta-helix repeat protein